MKSGFKFWTHLFRWISYFWIIKQWRIQWAVPSRIRRRVCMCSKAVAYSAHSKFSTVTPCRSRIHWKMTHLYPREHLALSQLLYAPIHRDVQQPGRLDFLSGRASPLFHNTQSLFELSVGDCVTRTVVQHPLGWNYQPGGFLWPNSIHRNDNNQTPIVPADTGSYQLISVTLLTVCLRMRNRRSNCERRFSAILKGSVNV